MTVSDLDGSPTESISDEDWLYRRLALNHLRSDGTVNRTAFMRNSVPPNKGKEPDPEVSVDLARLTTPPNSPAGSLATAGKPHQGIAAMQAVFPRGLGLEVIHAPVTSPPELRNPAHSLILGNAGERAMELCDRMALELSKQISIYPVGSPWRRQSEQTEQP
jgi:hypothetical protein